MNKTIVAIGGGEIKNKTTLEIDRYVASLARERAGERRPNALFIGTASHDFMPYFNSFRKTYTSVLDIKVDVALTVFKETEHEKLVQKFAAADMLYVGGGDTAFMIDHWRRSGLLPLIEDAYERGVMIAGLSAGGICWFEEMYTDSAMMNGTSDRYEVMPALGWLKGLACPHYNERAEEFDRIVRERGGCALGIEDNCALVFEDGRLARTVTAGGCAYSIASDGINFSKQQLR